MRAAAIACLAVIAASSVQAATYIVDDTSSIPYESTVTTRWRDGPSAGRQMSNEIEGAANVTLRLNVQPWLNRNGRIYLALPQQAIGVVNVEWSTQGRLLSGKLQSGERTLVYVGPIRAPILEDTFTVHVAADGRRVNQPHRIKLHFEIDVD